MNEFEIKDCVLLPRMSGLPPAVNLRELRDRIAACHPDVIYHHFCETTLAPSFDYPDYRNHFAVWAKHSLGDEILAERLGIIDPYAYTSLEDLRTIVLEIIEERLSELSTVPWARSGHEFYFMKAVTVVFDTGERIRYPDELDDAISRMTNGSIYFHVLEARRRQPIGLDDFSAWLENLEGDWSHYIHAIAAIDVTFCTLHELQKNLVKALKGIRGKKRKKL
jgi:hypothetical protein